MPQELPEFSENIGGAQIMRRGNSAIVDFQPGMDSVSMHDSEDHKQNLAESMEPGKLTELADRIIEYVDADLQARSDWDARMNQALELLGLKNRPEEELWFEGASAVTYPLIGEAVVQFQARAIEELFPSEGPVKTRIIGKRSPEKEEQGQRVAEHMNYQMTEQDKSYFWHVDQMLFFLPLGGSAFKKSYYDPVMDMVVSRFIKAKDFIVPYSATDLQSSPRYTHRMQKNRTQLRKLMASGFYRDLPLLGTPIGVLGRDDGQQMLDEADSRTESSHWDDVEFILYETHIDLEIEEDQEKYGVEYPLPYVVTVDKETREVLSIRRNWKETDEEMRKRVWFTHYRYLPGLGFYGFGLLHMIGSVAEATSGSIRALLDSAAFANMQGGFISEDVVGLQGGDMRIEPGMYKRVKGSAEDIARGIYTPNFKEPSQALQKLFETLVDAGRRFASATDEMVGDAPNTGPVGTTIALIEQGSKVFSGIHRRLHMAAAEEFQLRAELNFEFLDEEYPFEIEGEEKRVLRSDYDGRIDIVPVSDPNIFSSAQRIAQAQALYDLSTQNPDLYDRIEVNKRFLKAIRVSDPENLLKTNQTVRCDAVSENVKLMTGEPVKAFVEQDHDAHIQTHMSFLQGLNEDALALVGPPMQAHLAEHYALKYWAAVNQKMGGQLPPPDSLGQLKEQGGMDPQMDMLISQMAAQLPPLEITPPDEGGPSDAEQEAAEWQAEQQRRQQAWEDDEVRKQLSWEAEQLRKEQEFEGTEARKDVSTAADVSRKEEQHRLMLQEKQAAAKAAKAKAKGGGNGKAS
jgi:hypothetical protein